METLAKVTVVTLENGVKQWLNNKGLLHRLRGPAVEYPNGDKEWYQNGLKHRPDGPAVERGKARFWYQKGQLHRTDGPSCEYTDGVKAWHLNGRSMSEEEFIARTSAPSSKDPKRADESKAKRKLARKLRCKNRKDRNGGKDRKDRKDRNGGKNQKQKPTSKCPVFTSGQITPDNLDMLKTLIELVSRPGTCVVEITDPHVVRQKTTACKTPKVTPEVKGLQKTLDKKNKALKKAFKKLDKQKKKLKKLAKKLAKKK